MDIADKDISIIFRYGANVPEKEEQRLKNIIKQTIDVYLEKRRNENAGNN